ncbi:MAG TPA: 50S ribosomal protein L6 [Candidatus Nanoarchaeia archaeon]|nr:50S ribosomal protein L6 [Candidatus Nanoarchaeia archaeon]
MSEQKKQSNKENRKQKKDTILVEVEVPQGVTASLKDSVLTVKAGKNEVNHRIELRKVSLEVKGNKVTITGLRATQKDKRMVNSIEAHVNNLIKGVQNPYEYTLKVCSGHFPITIDVKADRLTVKNFFGEKVPRILQIKKGATVKVEGEKITVESPSKEIAGQVSADIEQLTRRTGYDGRIFQDGIHIINKDGRDML